MCDQPGEACALSPTDFELALRIRQRIEGAMKNDDIEASTLLRSTGLKRWGDGLTGDWVMG